MSFAFYLKVLVFWLSIRVNVHNLVLCLLIKVWEELMNKVSLMVLKRNKLQTTVTILPVYAEWW